MPKRKRDTEVIVRPQKPPPLDTDDREIFRRYFERQYEPIEENLRVVNGPPETTQEVSSDAASQSDWEGLSGDESDSSVEVVEYGISGVAREPVTDTPCSKSFMSAKPPVSGTLERVEKGDATKDHGSTDEAATDAINLKHDVELQRLLKESHLLDRSSGSSLTHINRHKAMDLRLQSLGAKSSLFTQAKMPLSHHQGIVAKAKQRETVRRREAKENGIVLEKEARPGAKKSTRRERGVGGPSIGKFRGGILHLSSKDVGQIQGPQRKRKAPQQRRG